MSITKNWLNRQFHAVMPNEKRLTDVTGLKGYEGPVVHNVHLSAILDLYDRRIVAISSVTETTIHWYLILWMPQ